MLRVKLHAAGSGRAESGKRSACAAIAYGRFRFALSLSNCQEVPTFSTLGVGTFERSIDRRQGRDPPALYRGPGFRHLRSGQDHHPEPIRTWGATALSTAVSSALRAVYLGNGPEQDIGLSAAGQRWPG